MTTLTRPQVLTLRAAINADATVMAQLPTADQPAYDFFNTATTFIVWRSSTLVQDLQDAITWANFTPVNPTAGAGSDATNWLLACQGKQFNLQNLLLAGQGFVSTRKPNIRAGLQDALTAIPSGVNGATKTGGWPAVQLVIQRPATKAEQLLATGTGTTASPGDLVWEGQISQDDLYFILGRDGN